MLSLLPTGVHHAATSIERRRGDEKITRDLCRHKLIFLSLFGGTLALAGSRSGLYLSLSLCLSLSPPSPPSLPLSLSLSLSLYLSSQLSSLSCSLRFLSLSLTHSLSLSLVQAWKLWVYQLAPRRPRCCTRAEAEPTQPAVSLTSSRKSYELAPKVRLGTEP